MEFTGTGSYKVDTPSAPMEGEAVPVDVYSFDRQKLYTDSSEKTKNNEGRRCSNISKPTEKRDSRQNTRLNT